MATFVYPAVSVDTTLLAKEATLQQVAANTANTVTELQTANTSLDSLETLVLTNTQLRATPVPVTGPLTDVQLRATAVPVSGPLTDTQLRAAAVPVSAASLPLPTGASTEATQLTVSSRLILSSIDQLDTALLNTAVTNIPASSSLPLQVVASTAAATRQIISVEDIGEYIGLYTGAAAAEVLLIVLPLGGGTVDVTIPASTRISLRAMENSVINIGKISINFLG
jgi:hypothetical protein